MVRPDTGPGAGEHKAPRQSAFLKACWPVSSAPKVETRPLTGQADLWLQKKSKCPGSVPERPGRKAPRAASVLGSYQQPPVQGCLSPPSCS